ncbi:MAG: hypothetical protein Q4F95_00810 [Oscillospiraceae bacterium]|nr:hypothetical protein [Oscillospiraceae bacterium]
MGAIKKKSIAALADGMDKFEFSKKNVDLSGIKDISDLMNMIIQTSDKKKRKKLLDEFKNRKLEFYEFLKSNPELITAEAETARIIKNTLTGKGEDEAATELNNLFEAIESSLNGDDA